MEPLLFDVKSFLDDSIFIKEINVGYLEDQFHFHNAHEIALIIKGQGKRVIGDSIESFSDGDLVFLGPHIPHVSYFNGTSKEISAIVIYFHPDWLSEKYLDSPHQLNLKKLLHRMQRGVTVSNELKKLVSSKIIAMKNATGFRRIIGLMDILDLISAGKYEILASEGYSNTYEQKDIKRIEKVYEYVLGNFTETIMLDDIASIANMTSTAFCKYFKSKTQKTFSNFVNELRIGYACKLLCNEDLSISQVCFKCGFNNLTNFNRNFKNITGMSPSQYKDKIKN